MHSTSRVHTASGARRCAFPAAVGGTGPALPLRCAAASRPFPPLLACVRQVAGALAARGGRAADGITWWLTAPAEEFTDDRSVLFGLDDSPPHQGTCCPHTAGEIPLLAGLAAHEECVPPDGPC